MKKNQFKRIFVIVADSLGIGEAPDAKKYNDLGCLLYTSPSPRD